MSVHNSILLYTAPGSACSSVTTLAKQFAVNSRPEVINLLSDCLQIQNFHELQLQSVHVTY